MPTYATFPSRRQPPSAPHPQDAAWCGSRLLLSWVGPLMKLGNRKQLDASDVWPLRPPMQARNSFARFDREFAATGSIPRSFFRVFGGRFVLTGIAFLGSMLCNLVGPVALDRVVSELSGSASSTASAFALSSDPLTDICLWVALLFASQVAQALADNYANFDSEVIAIQFTSALKTLLYRKTLRLNAESRMKKSTGEISNMYTSDSDSLLAAAFLVHQAWLIPLQIAVVSALLFRVLGVAALAGIAVIIIMLYLNQLVSNRMFRLMRTFRSSKDVRMKKVSELFKAISIVKFNAWEDKFAERVGEARTVELDNLLQVRYMTSASIVLMWGMPVFISIGAFGTYSMLLKHTLTPAIVFTSIALFQLIQGPLRFITNIITMLIQSKVALERVSAFLAMDEIDPNAILTPGEPGANDFVDEGIMVSIRDGEFMWDEVVKDDAKEDGKKDGKKDTKEDSTPSKATTLLKNVNFDVHVGDFVVVHGTVGCGKSSLCSAILGEMKKREGTVFVGGSVAYCAQQPWIQNMTVRDNILFGLPFDRRKYDKVLDACALTADLKSLPGGDQTEIGERGVNVSGGQKARIALARACYADASIYILDSPLAAVDAIVQNEIFQKCLLGLLRHKTVILVTHNPDIIASPHITRAVTINEIGSIVQTHETNEVPTAFTPLVSPLAASTHATLPLTTEILEDNRETGSGDGYTTTATLTSDDRGSSDNVAEDIEQLNDEIELMSPFRKPTLTPKFSHPGTETQNDADDVVVEGKDDEEDADEEAKGETGKLIIEEERSEGRVGMHVFAAYYHAIGGFWVVTIILLTQVAWQVLQIGSDFWLSSWSNDSAKAGEDGVTEDSTAYRLAVYSALGLLAAFMVLVRTLIITIYGMEAAKSLFNRMTNALLNAPMRFFDVNPIGRILTRYGGDVAAVDMQIPFMFGTLAANLFSVGCSAATAAFVIQWKGLLLIPVIVLYVQLGAFYIQPARELQRLLQTTRAPILNHLSETIDGVSTVRAFGSHQLSRFCQDNNGKLDGNHIIWFAQLCASQWFSLRIQLLGAMLLLVVTSSLVVLRNVLDPAIIALAFSYALKVSTNLEGIVRVLTRIETIMVSPERMQQYIDIVQEPPHHISSVDETVKSEKWPSTGALAFEHVAFKYKPSDPLVLRDVNFSAPGGFKIGIVGRTGAGKSSLTMALFRINELAGGTISIDGVDISKLGLTTLRERLSIIPQHPVLFKGTLRSYLDPFDEFSDEELWRSVDQVGLRERVSSDELKLLLLVEENGENFSVGERQMLCMARALLRNSRVVVFDEATAAIDHETDQKLQGVIRSAFKESTVLTIAHRLDTILDSDRVLVLDGGKVVAFASPRELVDRGEGHFFELMREAGLLDSIAD